VNGIDALVNLYEMITNNLHIYNWMWMGRKKPLRVTS